uniref:transposase n=1 Tax=Paenibacillus daejeonensis TaxID=135193 RepID=UPI001B7FB949
MTTITQSTLNELVENLVTDFVKNTLETIMRAEIQSHLEENQDGPHNSRNGYYKRTLHTKFGH